MPEQEDLLTAVQGKVDEAKTQVSKEIDDKLGQYASQEEVTAMKEALAEIKSEKDLDAVKVAITTVEASIKALKEKPSNVTESKDSIINYLNDSAEKIKDFRANDTQSFKTKIALKDFSIGSSFTDDVDGIPFLPVDFKDTIAETPDVRENFNILNYITVGSTDRETISWMEEESETGEALFIAECVAKPTVSKTWTRNKTSVQKVADFSKVCDEVLLYLPRMKQLIEQFLRKLVTIAIQDAILNGDGTGSNLLGIIPQATAFVAGGKADSVPKANYADAIRATASQIKCLGYMPNIALVNCDDLFAFESIKDENGQYLNAPLGGVKLVECPFIVSGEFLVGDFKMSNVNFFMGITSEWDRNNNDFRDNAISVRSEAFLSHHIPSNNVGAFITDTFANVVTLINKETP